MFLAAVNRNRKEPILGGGAGCAIGWVAQGATGQETQAQSLGVGQAARSAALK